MPTERFAVDFVARGATGMNRAIRQIQGSLKGLAGTVKGITATIGVSGLAGGIGVGGLAAAVSKGSREVDKLAKTSTKLNTAVGNVQALELVAAKASTNVQTLTQSFSELASKVVEAGRQIKAGATPSGATSALLELFDAQQLQSLGYKPRGGINEAGARLAGFTSQSIALAKSRGKPSGRGDDADQILQRFGERSSFAIGRAVFDALSKRSGPTQRNILGRLVGEDRAAEFLPLLRTGEGGRRKGLTQQLREASRTIGSERLTERDRSIAEQTQDQLAEATNAIQNFWRGIAVQPEALQAAKALNEAVREFLGAIGGSEGAAQTLRSWADSITRLASVMSTPGGINRLRPDVVGAGAGLQGSMYSALSGTPGMMAQRGARYLTNQVVDASRDPNSIVSKVMSSISDDLRWVVDQLRGRVAGG